MKKKIIYIIFFTGFLFLLLISFNEGEKKPLLGYDSREYYPPFNYKNKAFEVNLNNDISLYYMSTPDVQTLGDLIFSTRYFVSIEPKGDTLITNVELYENDKAVETEDFKSENGAIDVQIWNDEKRNAVEVSGIYKGQLFSVKLDIELSNSRKSITNALNIFRTQGHVKYTMFSSKTRVHVVCIYKSKDDNKYAGKVDISLFQRGEKDELNIRSHDSGDRHRQYEFNDFGVNDFHVNEDTNGEEMGKMIFYGSGGSGVLTRGELYNLGNLSNGTGIDTTFSINNKYYTLKIPKEYFYSFILAKQEAQKQVSILGYLKRIPRGFLKIIRR